MQNQNGQNKNGQNQNQYENAFRQLDGSIGRSTNYGRYNTMDISRSNDTIGNSNFPNNLPDNQQMYPYVTNQKKNQKNKNQINQNQPQNQNQKNQNQNQNKNQNQIDKMSVQRENLEDIQQNMRNRLPVSTTANQQEGPIFGSTITEEALNNMNWDINNSLYPIYGTQGTQGPQGPQGTQELQVQQELVLNPMTGTQGTTRKKRSRQQQLQWQLQEHK